MKRNGLIKYLLKKRKRIVKALYVKGRIDSGTAAKWLEINEKEFINFMMIEGYREYANEDLSITREFEEVEKELDNKTNTAW